MEQQIIYTNIELNELAIWIEQSSFNSIMLVCGENTCRKLRIDEFLIKRIVGKKLIRFKEFEPNPTYQSVLSGVKLFRNENCDCIIAIGGGSAIDVAKCIKLYSFMNGNGEDGAFLTQRIVKNDISLVAMPTTAGTGSEATRFAVIYYQGIKQSVCHESGVPEVVFFNPDALSYLPDYQRKSTMLDALSHAMESFWSVNSTEISKRYSIAAINSILNGMQSYLSNTPEGNAKMLAAANMAGKAINITETTAGHAMCYKLTSTFGIAHGHAAFLCNKALFPWMVENLDRCTDKRGKKYLEKSFNELAKAFGCNSIPEAIIMIDNIFEELQLSIPCADEKQFETLATSVNSSRLKNNPVELDAICINDLYRIILRAKK